MQKAKRNILETESAAQAITNTAEANRQALITALSQDPTSGNTIIDGGYIKTSLIDADGVLANDIKSTGSIRVGDRFNADGTVADSTKTGVWFGNSGILRAHKAELTDVIANGGTFSGNVNISGIAVAANISLSGFKAGDILLRDLGGIDFSNYTTKKIYTQICGTGEVRVKIVYVSQGDEVSRIDSFITIKGSRYIVSHAAGTYTITEDIPVEEGESIEISATITSSGVAGGTRFEVSSIKLYTDGENGILAYLGSVNSSTNISPAR